MTKQNPSRRAILGGIAVVPMAVVPCAAATPSAATAVGLSADLAALIAKVQAASAVGDEHYSTIYEPAYERMVAAIEAVPHVEMTGGENVLGGTIVRSTAEAAMVSAKRTVVRMAREGKLHNSEAVAYARRFHAAYLRRERTLKAIRRRSGIDQIIADNNALNDAVSNAQYAVAEYPVRSAADLSCKLAFMIERQMGDGMDWLPELLADARALAGEG